MKSIILTFLLLSMFSISLHAQSIQKNATALKKAKWVNDVQGVMDGSTTIKIKAGETETFTEIKIGGNRSVYYYDQSKLSIPSGISFSRDGSPYGNLFGTYVDFTISVDDTVSAGDYQLLVGYEWYNAPINGTLVYDDTLTINLTVYVYDPPVADFVVDTTEIFKGDSVVFTNTSTGTITDFEWRFGDDSSSTFENPTHIYQKPGQYTVQFKVDGPGGSDSKIANNLITVNYREPVAHFIATPANGIVPLAVQFSNQSTGTDINHFWKFGDGDTSSEQNPEHVYETTGTFIVELTVSNPAGSHSKTDSIIVQYPAFVADDEKRPSDFELLPNFPNPFNPSTAIKIALPQTTYFTLSVYNITGMKIADIFQGTLEAGYHTMMWHAQNNPSGTYFIKLTTSQFSQIRKCLLLK